MTKKYNHREAFCLMWYACRECGARSRFWNSRDGVTPFCTKCSSCGQMEMYHIDFYRDLCVPDHKPWPGQYVWIDLTVKRAEEIANEIQFYAQSQGHTFTEQERSRLVAGFFANGTPPDLVVEPFSKI